MRTGIKSAKGGNGLVNTPPISAVKALRLLEYQYARQAEKLEKLEEENKKLKAKLKGK